MNCSGTKIADSAPASTDDNRSNDSGQLAPLQQAFATFTSPPQTPVTDSSSTPPQDPTPSQTTSPPPTEYLPWTLDVDGYEPGECEVTDLARSFKEARGWASEHSGWIDVHSIIESPGKITISYYDGLIKAESIRTFYKDMKTCKAFGK